MSVMSERWLPIVGFEGRYEVSDQGRVKSLARLVHRPNPGLGRAPQMIPVRERIMRPWKHQDGYLGVELRRGDGKRTVRLVHCLVMEAFVGLKPAGMLVRHLDGDPTDNRLVNLAYGTPSENQLDKVRHGTDHNVNKTHCPARHRYTSENTYIHRGRRSCKECKRRQCRAYRARKAQRPTIIVLDHAVTPPSGP
ncbi:MAG: NUMOD4 motif-containing HNH endonuclease [Pseudonocardia sp.]|nr:NUMOD4 motif-containing HNH endonuclease [Pseudonocardia sp.]